MSDGLILTVKIAVVAAVLLFLTLSDVRGGRWGLWATFPLYGLGAYSLATTPPNANEALALGLAALAFGVLFWVKAFSLLHLSLFLALTLVFPTNLLQPTQNSGLPLSTVILAHTTLIASPYYLTLMARNMREGNNLKKISAELNCTASQALELMGAGFVATLTQISDNRYLIPREAVDEGRGLRRRITPGEGVRGKETVLERLLMWQSFGVVPRKVWCSLGFPFSFFLLWSFLLTLAFGDVFLYPLVAGVAVQLTAELLQALLFVLGLAVGLSLGVYHSLLLKIRGFLKKKI